MAFSACSALFLYRNIHGMRVGDRVAAWLDHSLSPSELMGPQFVRTMRC